MTASPRTSWLRVRKGRPCPVCGKTVWCLIHVDGTAAICPRTPSGIRAGDGGYLHKLDGSPLPAPQKMAPRERPARELSRAELELLARQYRTALSPGRLGSFATSMGLSVPSLLRLDIGWSAKRELWTFPMVDAYGVIRGFRTRNAAGEKKAVMGGREGIFLPTGLGQAGPLLLCEGPTSCAALLDLGFDAIGRPSCNSGGDIVIDYLKVGPKRDVVVFGDHDEAKTRPDGSKFFPGQDGAERLASRLVAERVCRSVKVLVPPLCKDARDWKLAGATRTVIEATIRPQPYWRGAA